MRAATWVVTIGLALLLAGGVGTTPPTPSSHPARASHSLSIAPTATPPLSPRPKSLGLHIAATLALLNDTLLPGNVRMQQADLPDGVAYDASTHLLYIGYGLPNGLGIVDWTNSTVRATLPLPLGPTDVLDDPVAHHVLVTQNDSVLTVNAATLQLGVRMPTGRSPLGMALDPVPRLLFVANGGSNNVSEINLSSHQVVRSIPVGSNPWAVAFSPVSGYLYVANQRSNNVTVVNASSGARVASVPVGSTPQGIAYDRTAGRVFVGNAGSNNVTVFDDGNLTRAGSVSVGMYPGAVIANPANPSVYVTNYGSNSVSVINGSTLKLVASLPTGVASAPYSGTTDPSGKNLFVALLASQALWGANSSAPFSSRTLGLVAGPTAFAEVQASDTVYLIDNVRNLLIGLNETTGRIVGNTSLASHPQGILYDRPDDRIYVSRASVVQVFNATTLAPETSLGAGLGPLTLAFDPVDRLLFVASLSYSDSNVSVISTATNTVVRTMTVAQGPGGIAYDPVNQRVYVTSTATGKVSVLDPIHGAYLGNITVGSIPAAVTYDPFTQQVLVEVTEPDYFEVIDPANSTVVNKIALPLNSGALVVDPADRAVAVGGSNLTILSATNYSHLGSVPVGYGNSGLVFAAGNGRVYASNLADGSVSLLATGPPAPPYIRSFTAAPSVVRANHTTNLSVGAYGDGPLTYAYLHLPPGCLSTNASTLACAPTSDGNYSAEVAVSDIFGGTSYANASLRVTTAQLASTSIRPTSLSVFVGTNSSFSADARFDDGTNASAYATFAWGVLPGGVGTLNRSTGASVTFRAVQPGTATLRVSATINGRTINASASLTVLARPTPQIGSVSLTPPGATLLANGTQGFAATAADTTGAPLAAGVSFSWSVWPATLGTLNTTTGSVVTFGAGAEAGLGTINVTASRNGIQVKASASLTVNLPAAPTLSSVGILPATATVAVSSSVTFVATARDPAALVIAQGVSFQWSLTPTSLATLNATTGSTVSVVAGAQPGNLSLSVRAAFGARTASAAIQVRIVASNNGIPPGNNSTGAGPSSSGGGLVVGLSIAGGVAALAVIATFLVVRRRRTPPTARDQGGPGPALDDGAPEPEAGPAEYEIRSESVAVDPLDP